MRSHPLTLTSTLTLRWIYPQPRSLPHPRRFERHDSNKSGALERDQLLNLLQEIATASDSQYSHASEADVEFVISRCDKSGEGSINFSELGPAIATWKEAAKNVAPEKDNSGSSSCSVL